MTLPDLARKLRDLVATEGRYVPEEGTVVRHQHLIALADLIDAETPNPETRMKKPKSTPKAPAKPKSNPKGSTPKGGKRGCSRNG